MARGRLADSIWVDRLLRLGTKGFRRWVLGPKYRATRRRVGHRLKECPDQPVRVLFLVRDNAKWGAQSVYEALEADPRFEPVVAASALRQAVGAPPGRYTSAGENFEFFRQRGMRAVQVFDDASGAYTDLRVLEPDVVFYDQPYGLPRMHRAETVARFALTCYIPYGYGIYLAKRSAQLGGAFLPLVWAVFLERPSFFKGQEDAFPRLANARYCGYPKMDGLLKHDTAPMGIWPNGEVENRKRVIFAPHHSLAEDHRGRYATFGWSGEWLLAYAREHSEVDWVFKPHPLLRKALVENGLMSDEEADEYYRSWAALPNAAVYTEGDYLGIFASSDALVTDCGSFLLEYLYTGQPLIHLVNPNASGYSLFGERVVEGFYKAADVVQLERHLEEVVLAGNDWMGERRLRIGSDDIQPAGECVGDVLRRELLPRNDRRDVAAGG